MIGKPVITNDQKTFGSIYDYDNNRIVRLFTLFKDKYIRKGGDIVSDDLKVVFKDKLLMNSLGNRIAIEVELNGKVGFQIYNFGGGQYSDGDIEMKNFQNIDENYYTTNGIIKSEKLDYEWSATCESNLSFNIISSNVDGIEATINDNEGYSKFDLVLTNEDSRETIDNSL